MEKGQSAHPAGISIHALREEGDTSSRPLTTILVTFLSTPSARRATWKTSYGEQALTHFYPRPPRGGRRCRHKSLLRHRLFLSTPSARRATIEVRFLLREFSISIHALREEGDVCHRKCSPLLLHFYPRPPRGGRPVKPLLCIFPNHFYPRPPRGGRLPHF